LSKLNQVVGLARLLIRQEVRCANLASRVLSLGLQRLPSDWQARYGIRPAQRAVGGRQNPHVSYSFGHSRRAEDSAPYH
jgi:hypothetical protein